MRSMLKGAHRGRSQEIMPGARYDVTQGQPRGIAPVDERSVEVQGETDAYGNHSIGGQLPGGPSLNVITNHNVHLSRKEWLFRGVVGAVGNALAWPFRLFADLVGYLLKGIIGAVIGVVKVALIIIAVPTLLWLGLQVLEMARSAESAEDGAAMVTEQAGALASGVSKGLDKGLSE